LLTDGNGQENDHRPTLAQEDFREIEGNGAGGCLGYGFDAFSVAISGTYVP
jgi:hypothetical protein